ncbi:MAG TPA: DUF1513 domain-containing protein [Bdellovibrio sp.]|uniref:DUF1513 domain-containing protein n=1 Tax=Bdellovibrio sp. TaxID=28201 RepID=UPI002EDF1823
MTKRRQVLGYLGGTFLSLLFDQPLVRAASLATKADNNNNPWDNRGFALGTGAREKRLHPDTPCPVIGSPGHVIAGNFSGTSFKTIPTQFLPHQIIQNSKNPDQLFAVHKWGESSVEISLTSEKTRSLPLPANHYFYGHGVMSPNNEHVLIGAMDYKANVGVLLIYNTKTLKLDDLRPTYGVLPHDMQLSADQKHLFIMHSGLKPDFRKPMKAAGATQDLSSNLARIDFATGKLIDQINLEHGDKGYGHFVITGEQKFLCFGVTSDPDRAHLPTAIASITDKTVTDLTLDPILTNVHGEALSARKTLDGKKVIVTIPSNSAIVILDAEKLKPMKVISNIEIPSALVYSPDPSLMIVSRAQEPMVAYSIPQERFSSLDKIAKINGSLRTKWIGTGSHGTEIVWPS